MTSETVHVAAAAPAPAEATSAEAADLRWPTAAAALVAAAAHVPVTGQHLQEVPYVGGLFVGLVAVCLLGAVAVLVSRAPAVLVGLGGACLAAVLSYGVSRGPGLPGMADDIGDWSNELGLVSVAAESIVVLLCATALLRRVRRPALWLLAMAAAGAVLTAATYAAGVVLS